MKTVKVEVFSPLEVAKDGFYKWVGATNDCDFFGEVKGYEMGFCIEVRLADGSLDYSSVHCLPYVPQEIHIAETMDETFEIDYRGLDGLAELCLHKDGSTLTGRLVFRGYFESYYDFEERDEFIRNKSDEVIALFKKYVVA